MGSPHRILHDIFLAPYRMEDPGDTKTIHVAWEDAVIPIVTTGAETRTLAQPTGDGHTCTVVLETDGGDLTLTVTGGYNAAALTSITFEDAGDWVQFYSVKVGSSYYWRVLKSDGTDAPDFQLLGGVQTIAMNDAEVALTLDATGTQLTSNMLDVDAESGATEDLLLPAEAGCNGMMLFIKNTGGEDIVVKDDSDTDTIVTISTTEVGIVWCNGTAWTGGIMAAT